MAHYTAKPSQGATELIQLKTALFSNSALKTLTSLCTCLEQDVIFFA